MGLAGRGLPAAVVDGFRLELAQRSHPIVLALVSGEPVAFAGRGAHAFESPLSTDAFQAVPLARAESSGEVGPGLLLVAGPGEGPIEDEVTWAAELLGVRLAALWFRRAQADERRHQRERGWLLGIINAVTDPILLTDADGRILIANPGAERLLSADEKMSEGRRRAVALNNMLFSASLFPAIEEGLALPQGAAPRRPDRRPGPALRGDVDAGQGPAGRDGDGVGPEERLRPAPRQRGDRGELPAPARRRGRDARRARPAGPDPELGPGSHPGDRRRGQARPHEPAGRADVHRRAAASAAPASSAGCGPTTPSSPPSSRTSTPARRCAGGAS